MADENDVDEEELEEADWLLSTSYRFKIVDCLYPYIADEE